MLREVKSVSSYELPTEAEVKIARAVYNKSKGRFELKENYHTMDLTWAQPVEFLPKDKVYRLVFQGRIVRVMSGCDCSEQSMVLGPYYWDPLPLNMEVDKIMCIEHNSDKTLLLVEKVEGKRLPTLHITTIEHLHKFIG